MAENLIPVEAIKQPMRWYAGGELFLGAPGPLQQGARPLQAGGIGAEQRLGLQAGIWHRGRQL